MGLHDFTFYDLIRRNAACFPDRPAWHEVEDGRTLSFGEVADRVTRLARALQKLPVGQGERIAVLGQNSLEYFLLYGAAAALGAILLPINWRLSAEEVVFNIQDGAPTVLFVDGEFADLVQPSRSQLTTVAHYFSLHGGVDGLAPFPSLTSAAADTGPPLPGAGDRDGWVIIHTAAVAGRPRGALLSHGNLMCANMHWNYYLQTTPQDVHLNLLPLFHVAGLVMALQSFQAGAVNLNMRRFHADKAAALVAEWKVSQMFDFSPILGAILEAAENGGQSLKSLRAVVGLETPETIEKYQKASGGTFYCMYGQTETSALATVAPYDQRPGSAGRPILLAEVALLDDQQQPVETGGTGEIGVRGPMVFQGYWQLPAETDSTFRGGWHHTGDMGRFDEDGFLWYAGRKPEKELIKPGGENVYPAEVEKVILEHPAVAYTVVFGVPDAKWKEGIKAVCQLKPGQQLAAEELRAFVGERIARFKRPQYVEFIEEMPLLADGAPDRQRIKADYGGEQG